MGRSGVTTLEGKVALVTGAAVGIGEEIADRLAGAGADVAIAYHNREAAHVRDRVVAQGRRAHLVQLDATDSAQVTTAVHDAAELSGRLDIVVANAGGLMARVPIGEI
jgi:NAD(P)-dependent dehydrogenase (short-subunit alcohol dehydrogenase family)